MALAEVILTILVHAALVTLALLRFVAGLG